MCTTLQYGLSLNTLPPPDPLLPPTQCLTVLGELQWLCIVWLQNIFKTFIVGFMHNAINLILSQNNAQRYPKQLNHIFLYI
jgi:hypothetical protein